MREIDFPTDWVTADPIPGEHIAMQTEEGIYLIGLCLQDGANLWALIYDGGCRFARTTALVIGTGMEYRDEGEPSSPEIAAALERAWATLVQADTRAALLASLDADAMMRRN